MSTSFQTLSSTELDAITGGNFLASARTIAKATGYGAAYGGVGGLAAGATVGAVSGVGIGALPGALIGAGVGTVAGAVGGGYSGYQMVKHGYQAP